MKKIPALVWLPLALVVGGLVGAYGPMEELRTREERADAEKTKAKAKQKSAGAFGSFAQIVNIPDEAKRPRRPRPAPKAKAGKSAAATNSAESAEADVAATKTNAAKTNAPAARNRRPEKQLSPEDLKARIDEASDLWRTRIEVAKASAVSKLGLDDAGKESFETALDAMNDRLRDSMQIVADQIASAERMTPELGVRLMGDVSTALAETYDAIGACAGDGKRDEVSNLNLADFIDPSVAEPFVAVQDKLESMK
ncbi:MAG: hypothetical protein IJQ65_06700 [Kiritimatiellae bacterium]|nr:hypothetical protein [Kiritimatiellia bacterium]